MEKSNHYGKRGFACPTIILASSAALILLVFLISCAKSDHAIPPKEKSVDELEASDLLELTEHLKESKVTIATRSHGYIAKAVGHGVIPAGEYAGDHFNVRITGNYSGVGNNVLTSGTAVVRIRGERFESTIDPLLQSFCCGEGDLLDMGTHWEFTMFGQVIHSTAADPHNHLFAGFGSTLGTMNMNVADQSGTVVEPTDPPHDPGIGLIEDIPSPSARVRLH